MIDGRNQFNTLTIWPIAKVIHLLYIYGIILGFSTVTPISVDWFWNRYCIDHPQRPIPLMAYVTIGRPTPTPPPIRNPTLNHRMHSWPCLESKWYDYQVIQISQDHWRESRDPEVIFHVQLFKLRPQIKPCTSHTGSSRKQWKPASFLEGYTVVTPP